MRVRGGAALVTLGLVAACGSQVPPDVFYGAQGVPAGGGEVAGSASPTSSGAASSSAPKSGGSLPAATSSAAGSGAGSGAAAGDTAGSGAFGSTRAATATSAAPPHSTPPRGASHAATSSKAAPTPCTPPTASTPTVVVCPRTGLHDGQSVHVYASGFQNAKPSALTAALVVTECADKGNGTQPGDCGDLHFVNPDANGRVDLSITVAKVVGANKNACGTKYKCLISVAQPKQPPDYEADQYITFV